MIMPPEIAQALQFVSHETGALVTDSLNKFGNYKYFSHNQLKEKVGKLLCKHGLTMVTDEEEVTVKDKFMKGTYNIWLYHSSGVAYGPVRRTILLQVTGPQTFGIALSYVNKYFLRDILQLTVDDEDEGAIPNTNLPDSASVEETPKVDVEQLILEMKTDLASCESEEDLSDWQDLYGPQKPLLIQAQQAQITKLFTAKKAELKEKVDG